MNIFCILAWMISCLYDTFFIVASDMHYVSENASTSAFMMLFASFHFSIVLCFEIPTIAISSALADTYFSNFEKMMFGKLINLIAGDYNQKQLKKLHPIVKKINEFFTEFDSLSDDQIKAKTQEFKDRLAKGETLDNILPEAFAAVKQACKRMVGSEVEVK